MVGKWRTRFNRWMVPQTRRGPYRFLIKRWDCLSDIHVAARVFDCDFYRTEITPQALPIDKVKRPLVIAPHQDDETIGAGGTMLRAAAAGASNHVLYLTDGAQRMPGCPPAESIPLRNAEAKVACDLAGAEIHQLGISNVNVEPTREHLLKLSETIQRINPDVLLVPWLLDAPAKHRLVNHLLWLANRLTPLPNVEVWGYQVHNNLYPNGFVDITDVIETKRQMMAAFESQNTHFQCYDHLSMGMTAWNSRLLPKTKGDIRSRHAEVFFALPMRDHLDLVQRFYFDDLPSTYRGSEHVLPGISRLHAEVTKKC